MSYEGYVQMLCKKGHYWTHDAYDKDILCPDCGGEAVWCNNVDETNCEAAGYVELETLKIERRPHCKNITNRRYKIPKGKRK